MPKPTMSDVAAHAGVDISTVSRALNERTAALLRSETVDRVTAAAAELGYRPNVLARSLRTQRSHTIGMVIPDLTNPFFPPIVRGVEDVLDDADYTLIIANTDNDVRREQRSLRSLVGRQVDGLLVATSHLHDGTPGDEELGGLPLVLVNRRGSDPDIPSVVPDDVAGIDAVVAHLTGLGHHRIAHLAGPQDTSTGRTRAQSFRDAMSAAGLDDEDLIEGADLFDIDAGRDACERLLTRRPDLTAIVAANDLLAIGCIRAMRDRGLRVPTDVSLVGFNDMPLVDLIDPPLTTVRVPQQEMGRAAARILLDLLGEGGSRTAPTCLELPPELVIRLSTSAPATA
jgi:LacI family transcriptional regulator